MTQTHNTSVKKTAVFPLVFGGEKVHPFGMGLPGRQNTPENYRYGFNGKENDNEVKGTGNCLDFGARIYDSRLGRFLTSDPFAAQTPSESPYIFAGNSPISYIDYKGQYKIKVTKAAQEQGVTKEKGNIAAFERVVNALYLIAERNDNVLQVMSAQTGIDAEVLRANLKYGVGPDIIIEADENMKGWMGNVLGSGGNGKGIRIAASVVLTLHEKSTLKNNDAFDYEAYSFAVAQLAGYHEPTHEYDALFNAKGKEIFDASYITTEAKFDAKGNQIQAASSIGHSALDTEFAIWGATGEASTWYGRGDAGQNPDGSLDYFGVKSRLDPKNNGKRTQGMTNSFGDYKTLYNGVTKEMTTGNAEKSYITWE